MDNNHTFPPSHDLDTAIRLLNAADKIFNTHIRDDVVYPLLIRNKNKTCESLDLAGALYQNVLSSVYLAQYHRALLYLFSLKQFCSQQFGTSI